jgi:hypothetical protein
VPLRFPPTHPFNPLAALRLSIAAGNTPEAVDSIYDWLWAQGRAGDSVEALVPLMAVLNVPAEDLDAAPTKAALRANTDAAIAAGVYGVPTLAVRGELFWGNDAHDFALATLREPAVLDDAEMQRVSTLPVGLQRRRCAAAQGRKRPPIQTSPWPISARICCTRSETQAPKQVCCASQFDASAGNLGRGTCALDSWSIRPAICLWITWSNTTSTCCRSPCASARPCWPTAATNRRPWSSCTPTSPSAAMKRRPRRTPCSRSRTCS